MRRTRTSGSNHRQRARQRALALIEGDDPRAYSGSAYRYVETLNTKQKQLLGRLLRLETDEPHRVLIAIRGRWPMKHRRFVQMLFVMGWTPIVSMSEDDQGSGQDAGSDSLSVRLPKPRLPRRPDALE